MKSSDTLILSSREKEALEEFEDKLFKKFAGVVKTIVLFGSKARGDFSPDSDLDVLVITTYRNISLTKEISGISFDILLKYGLDISAKVFAEREVKRLKQHYDSFIENIEREGVELWKAA